MLDINFIHKNPDLIRTTIENKKKKIDFDAFLEIDKQRRELQGEIDKINHERNKVSKTQDIKLWKELKKKKLILEQQFKEINSKFKILLDNIPNIYSDDTPIGKDESENVVIEQIWKKPDFNFKAKEHWELWKELNLIDLEKAGKISGNRFAYLKNDLVLLQFAIVQHTLNTLTNWEIIWKIISDNNLNVKATPFIPILPPVFIKMEIMDKMARLHPMDDRYCFPEDQQCLVWSAEHTLWPLHMRETLEEKEFPIRYIGYSTAFRREAWSYGKDVKWILRQHQFDKLEMESFCLPENSVEEQDFFVAIQKYLVNSLWLPFQVVKICTGDMWWPDYRQLDIETWMPWQGTYRETHTSDLMTDYQSRRLKIKVKRANNKKDLIHMNDATAFAIGRIIIAIMENYQQEDGTILIPKVLQKYMNKKIIKT